MSSLLGDLPDVLLLEVAELGRVRGPRILRAVSARFPAVRIAVLSDLTARAYIMRCLEAGASGYLTRRSDPDLVVQALPDPAGGGAVFDPAVLAGLVQADRQRLWRAHRSMRALAGLRPRERQVLVMLGQGMPNAEIGHRLRIATSSVKGVVSAVLQKTGHASRLRAAVAAYHAGFPGLERSCPDMSVWPVRTAAALAVANSGADSDAGHRACGRAQKRNRPHEDLCPGNGSRPLFTRTGGDDDGDTQKRPTSARIVGVEWCGRGDDRSRPVGGSGTRERRFELDGGSVGAYSGQQ